MSLQTLTARDTLTIERRSVTASASGSQVETWGTGNRGTLPTSLNARAQPMNSVEAVDLGVRDGNIGWKFLCTTDPQVDGRDRVLFTDQGGTTRTVEVMAKSRDLDLQGRLYMFEGEEDATEA